jgi:predicted RNase H-like HicB family nuclease
MPEYICVIHHDQKSGFRLSFPDFPGLVTVVTSLKLGPDVAAQMAEALDLHIDGLTRNGVLLPNGSTIEELKANGANSGAVATMYFHREEAAS